MEENPLRFLSCQVAFVFKKPVISPEKYFEVILEKIPGVFGTNPTIESVPFMGEENEELNNTPVVVTVSEDERTQLNFARSRIDFFYNARNTEETFEGLQESFKSISLKLYDVISEFSDVKWVGFIAAFIYTCEDEDGMSNKIINSNILNINPGESNSFFVRNTNKIKVGDIDSFNLVAIGNGKAKLGDSKFKGLLFNQDFNTRPTEIEFNKEIVDKYLSDSFSLVKESEFVDFLKTE